MKIAKLLLLTCALAVASAFAAETRSDYDRAVDLTKLKSFTFVDQSRRLAGDPLASNKLADKRLHAAIENNLEAQGMRKEGTEADFVVAYSVTVTKKPRISGTGYGPFRFNGGQIWVDDEIEGDAMVDFLDPQTGDLIWRGYIRATIGKPEKSEKQINDAIKKLVDKFMKDRKQQAERRSAR
jgi:hypothetical protein